MANDFYTANADGSCYVGMFNRPSWVLNQPLNTWGIIPTTNVLADLNPRYDPAVNPVYPAQPDWEGTGPFAQIIGAWCGASFNFDLDELRISLPAGHDDYAGGEPYSIYLRSEQPAWTRMHEPAGGMSAAFPAGFPTDDNQDTTGLYQNGRPRAIHSYNKLIYIPGYGHAAIPQGSCSHSGQEGTLKPIIFDQLTGEMTRFGKALEGESPGYYSGGGTCWDPTRESVWVRRVGTGFFHRYHLPSDDWFKNQSGQLATSSYHALEYIPGYDCILWLNTTFWNVGEIAVIDCASGALYRKTLSGAAVGMLINGFCQPRQFATNKFACWNNSSNTTQINVLSFDGDPRSGVWSVGQLPVHSDNIVTPTVATNNGTYGRFFHSYKMGIFGTINHVTQRPYFYRYK